ncbi:MAG: hypothetical protein FJY97_11565 [candidate division Zixibacteria bacterium]|nr:hypothetical protein [candidate division Zixibacteria bacterium]
MSGDAPTPVDSTEQLARFVFFHRYVRADGMVRADAFIPHPYSDLSVTRHLALTEDEIWEMGKSARGNREVVLQGRADISAQVVISQSLVITPDEPPRNHAVITGWPPDKPAQKIKAQLLSVAARYLPKPG